MSNKFTYTLTLLTGLMLSSTASAESRAANFNASVTIQTTPAPVDFDFTTTSDMDFGSHMAPRGTGPLVLTINPANPTANGMQAGTLNLFAYGNRGTYIGMVIENGGNPVIPVGPASVTDWRFNNVGNSLRNFTDYGNGTARFRTRNTMTGDIAIGATLTVPDGAAAGMHVSAPVSVSIYYN